MIYVMLLNIVCVLFLLDKLLLANTSSRKISFNKKNKSIVLLNKQTRHNDTGFLYNIAILILFVFSAIRYNIGFDYPVYYEVITGALHKSVLIDGKAEHISKFLIELSQKTGYTFLYFIVTSFIVTYCISYGVKKQSSNPHMSMILYMTFPLFMVNSWSVIRFFTALSITFFGYKYIENKQYLKYLITILIAGGFHYTALICVIFPFIDKILRNRNTILLVLFSIPIIIKVVDVIVLKFMPQYRLYLQPTEIIEGTKAIFIILAVACVSLIFYDKLIENAPNIKLQLSIFYFGCMIYVAFARRGTLGHRMSLYGTIYMITIIPEIIRCLEKPLERLLVKVGVYALFFVSYIYVIWVNSSILIPFRTIFEFF